MPGRLNEWRWETFGAFQLSAAVLRLSAPAPIGPTWLRSVRNVDKRRQEPTEQFPNGIPSIFE